LIDFQGISTMDLEQTFCKENTNVINDVDFTPNFFADFLIKNELGQSVSDKNQKLSTQVYELRLVDKSNTLNCISSKVSKLAISVVDLKVDITDQKATTCGSKTGKLTVTPNNGRPEYSYSWFDPSGRIIAGAVSNTLTGLDEGEHTVKIIDKDGCSTEIKQVLSCIPPEIPQIITPGEKTNNKWVLNYTKKFPKVQVDIFNRWGSLVYKSPVPYNDEEGWDGTPNVGGTLGSERLPSGTYYYVIDRGNGDPIETGFIELLN
jgi:gliding motility-associated-like protein